MLALGLCFALMTNSNFIKPNHESFWYPSHSYDIEWTNRGIVHLQLELFSNDTWTSDLVEEVLPFHFLSIISDHNIGKYKWTIPSYLSPYWENDKRIKMTDLVNYEIIYSDNFTIAGISVNNINNIIQSNSLQNITWKSNNNINQYDIYLMDFNTNYYNYNEENIIRVLANNISGYLFEWNVPVNLDGIYKLGISTLNNKSWAISNKFEIKTITTTPTTTPSSTLTTTPTSSPTITPTSSLTTTTTSSPTSSPTSSLTTTTTSSLTTSPTTTSNYNESLNKYSTTQFSTTQVIQPTNITIVPCQKCITEHSGENNNNIKWYVWLLIGLSILVVLIILSCLAFQYKKNNCRIEPSVTTETNLNPQNRTNYYNNPVYDDSGLNRDRETGCVNNPVYQTNNIENAAVTYNRRTGTWVENVLYQPASVEAGIDFVRTRRVTVRE